MWDFYCHLYSEYMNGGNNDSIKKIDYILSLEKTSSFKTAVVSSA